MAEITDVQSTTLSSFDVCLERLMVAEAAMDTFCRESNRLKSRENSIEISRHARDFHRRAKKLLAEDDVIGTMCLAPNIRFVSPSGLSESEMNAVGQFVVTYDTTSDGRIEGKYEFHCNRDIVKF